MNQVIRSLTLVVLAAGTGTAAALPTAFTDPTDFLAALPGAASTLDFESAAAGTQIANGASLGGITFNYPVLAGLGVTMEVGDTSSAVSGSQYLTTNFAGFLNLDDLEFVFAAGNAFGLYILTAATLEPGDVRLTAGGATASLDPAEQIDFPAAPLLLLLVLGIAALGVMRRAQRP